MIEVTISKVRNSTPAQYLVRFRGYKPTDANLTHYRDQCFHSLQAARQFANRRILDAMGIF
jgi:hypothetical protein